MKKFLLSFFAFVIGIFGSFSVATYVNLPLTDELIITEEVFYSYNDAHTATADININDADVTVHFLELGNKYTGDCTYIKATGTDENGNSYQTDILIDCGSKSNSISTVA